MIVPKEPVTFFVVTEDKKTLGNFLYNERVANNLSQDDVAIRLGCHQPRIRSMEGLRMPRLENLVLYLDLLNLRLVIIPK